jgi:homoaconitate hydratase
MLGCVWRRVYSTKARKNMVEKIVQRYVTPSISVRAGEYVSIVPAHVMTHDNTSAVISKFNSIKSGLSIKNFKQPVFTLDHNVQDKSKENLEAYSKIQLFAEKLA